MLLKNAVILNDKFEYEAADVYIKDGKFEKIGKDIDICGEDVCDMSGKKILPGLINIHMHGAVGYNVTNANHKAYNEIGKYLASTGTTSYLMAPATYLKEDLIHYVKLINDSMKKGTEGANLLGINMEGPYLNPDYKGAHRADWLRTPKEVDFDEVNEAAGGNIRLVTLAPELDGAMEFVKTHKDKVKISLGHGGTDYEKCQEGFENGATQVTHLFNAMPSIHHRKLSLIAAAFESGAMAELICDGLHVDKTVVMMAYKMFGADRLIVINDSVMAAGLPDGIYSECGSEIIVKDGIALLKNGTICGGTAPIFKCVKNLISWGICEQDAVKMASFNAAKAIDEKNKGKIAEGCDADFIAVDKEFSLTDVFIGGKRFEN